MSSSEDCCLYFIAIFISPVSVVIRDGCGFHFFINLILYVTTWIGGVIHAIWLIAFTTGSSGSNKPRSTTPYLLNRAHLRDKWSDQPSYRSQYSQGPPPQQFHQPPQQYQPPPPQHPQQTSQPLRHHAQSYDQGPQHEYYGPGDRAREGHPPEYSEAASGPFSRGSAPDPPPRRQDGEQYSPAARKS